MIAAWFETRGDSAEEFARGGPSLNRLGQPHEVAQGSLWLASDQSSFVNGISLLIDGGYLANSRWQ